MATSSRRAAGPWVLVVGMHRSNTSALTGMLAGLGLALPPASDLVEGNPDNPVHYESHALIELDERLLRAVDGWWDRPPTLAEGWQDDPVVTGFDDEALATLDRVYDTPGPKVWKDPRLCLLLPYWLRLLNDPAPAVFVWRSPAEVADSLYRRDASTLSHGLALWSAYNRAALASLAGRPVHVVESEQLLDLPMATAETLAEWLDTQGIRPTRPGGWDVTTASAVIAPELARRGGHLEVGMPAEFAAMAAQLRELSGTHAALPTIDLGQDPPWAADVLDHHRRLLDTRDKLSELTRGTAILSTDHHALIADWEELSATQQQLAQDRAAADAEVARLESVLSRLRHERDVATSYAERVELELERVRASASWRITAPLRRIGGRPAPEGDAQ